MYQSTILITGGTVGLGYGAALAIAKAEPNTQVVIASRTDKDKAADSINKKLNQSNVVFMRLDLSDQANVRSFASAWISANHPLISALVLNAGLQFPASKPVYSKDGLEMTFAVNHVGHTLLFYLLQSKLAADCRIVITASGVHDPAQKTGIPDADYTSVEALGHPSGDALKMNGLQRYSNSKLCNVLWSYALDRRLKELRGSNPSKKWTVTAMDPGLMIETSLSREWFWPVPWLAQNVFSRMTWLLRMVMGPNVHTAIESGEALARLAISNDVQGVSGKYYEGLKEIPSSTDSRVKEKQDDIWSGTATLIAKDEDERMKFETLS